MKHRITATAALAATLTLGTSIPAHAADRRIAAADRYGTAAAVSGELTEGNPYVVYLATGENFPDALAASAAAGADQTRVLLTGRYEVPEATMAEIARLGAFTVYLIGGTNTVSTAAETQLERAGLSVLRLGGVDRYDTAVTTAKILWDTPDTVFLATGENYPDALSGAAAAGSQGAPILLVTRDGLPASVRGVLDGSDFLSFTPSRFFVLGGQSAVSDSVIEEIRSLGYQDAAFERLGGSNRYATAVTVGGRFFPGSSQAVLAVGDNFPDALSAGPFAAAIDAPLLLTTATATPGETGEDLNARGTQDRFFIGAARP